MQCNVSRTVVEHAYRDRVNWLTVVLRDRALTPLSRGSWGPVDILVAATVLAAYSVFRVPV